jgi:hypothetical protein
MADNIARWPGKHSVLAIVLVTSAVCACSSMGDNPVTFFAEPGKYEYFSCEQIAERRKAVAAREQELQMLMDKADQGAGGIIVNLLAYKADHVNASEELKVLDAAARAKNCEKRPTGVAIPR